ncbi:hypothetical protein L596_005384 [Steinernema carpocapsae]|uniref:Uncharacterized protein n=1 Tax=Steinernema carpocapsae TaxID=34508 RepID=A0A4U8V002_STECR|nr:hypothetical protein L596_005384 [Steinernema carpocapsae]
MICDLNYFEKNHETAKTASALMKTDHRVILTTLLEGAEHQLETYFITETLQMLRAFYLVCYLKSPLNKVSALNMFHKPDHVSATPSASSTLCVILTLLCLFKQILAHHRKKRLF